uniref:TATA box-binding protein-associated factor RNA polymerase I subunit D n=1 Tax=Aquarana catesbeiana TaxID=8400 RepID=C1C4X7_AQUCT|nr:JOSD3 [Aquarana catesbeiana]
MDHFHAQHIQGNGSGSPNVDFPQSQELFSDQEHTEHDPDDDHAIRHEADISSQNDNSNLFEDQIVCTPTRTQLARRCKKLNSTPIQNTDSESSDYEPPPRKLTLKEIFDNHFRKKRKYKRKKKPKKRNLYLCSEKKQPRKVKKRKPVYSISASQRKSRLLHCGIRFPFASKKYLSLKLCFAYEQYVLGGFLNYVKNIKYENHLQKSLLDMSVGGELEEGSLEARKFKYLDDEEPLSPIFESGESDECETQYCDAKIVDTSSFILDCRIPSKEQWKI